jgi:putative cell wall-binding protein
MRKVKTFKQSIALLLALVMMFTMVPYNAMATKAEASSTTQGELQPLAGTGNPVIPVWDGTSIDTSWYDHAKTEYNISTAAQLAGLAAIVNGEATDIEMTDFYGKTVNLTANLDLGGVYDEVSGTWSGPTWQPIGGAGTVAGPGNPSGGQGVFAGTFNGNGHKVANMYLYRWDPSEWADSVGLFGKVSGTVRGITVTGYVYSNRSVAGVVGRAMTSRKVDGTVIGPALVEDCINYADVTGTDSKGVGGVVGAGWASSTVRGCTNYGTITTKYSSGIVGGVVGDLQGYIENCANYGTVQASPATDRGVGGVIGNMSAYSQGPYHIKNCVNYGEVKTAACLGGIMGRRYDAVAMTIENCYNYGKISGGLSSVADYSVGGIVGFAGTNQNMIIKNCYNAGEVSTEQTGKTPYAMVGLITSNGNVTIDNCYYLKTGSITSDPGTESNCTGTATAKTETEMKAEAFVATLGKAYTKDYEGEAALSGGYPILFWQNPSVAGQKFTVTVDPEISNGSVEVQPVGTVLYMTQVNISSTPELGYILDYYTVNGERIEGNTADITANSTIGAVFRKRLEAPLTYTDTDVYKISVSKSSGLIKDDAGNFQEVAEGVTTPPVVVKGDTVFEGDVLTVDVLLKEDAPPVEDTALEYSGAFDITVANTTRSGSVYQGYKYTVNGTGEVEVSIDKAHTQNKCWSTLADTSWYDAEKTEFTLTTAAQLAGLAELVAGGDTFEGKVIKLGNNISLEDTITPGVTRQWNPIGGRGSSSRQFKGTFDGQGHTISNFVLFNSGSNYTALFGSINDATVKNLTVDGGVSSLTNNSNTALIVGYANNSNIQNCINKASLTGAYTYGNMGGVVGTADGTTLIEGCANYGTILSNGTTVGGIAGNVKNTATIRNSFNAGNISDTKSTSNGIGGVVGKQEGTMENCYNSGTITAINYYAGGVAGQVSNRDSKMVNCYNTGEVKNSHNNKNARLGGLAGSFSNGSMSNCYNTGKITKDEAFVSTYVGAAAGQVGTAASLSNIYYDEASCAYGVQGESHAGVTAKTAAEMKNADFVSMLGEAYVADTYQLNGGYPVLTWQFKAKDDQEAADAVIRLINEIGEVDVSDACRDRITAARGAYDRLTGDQQLLVTNEDVLVAAEVAYGVAVRLVEAKTAAKNELDNYKDPDDYSEAQQAELAEAIAAGKSAIDAAVDIAGVNSALAAAKAAIDEIKTDAQLVNEQRLAGDDRYATAVKVSQAGWTTAGTVILARGDDFADAVAGVPLAHQLNAPILLTQTNSIVPATIAEITRLKAERVIILGGPGAISDDVMGELEDRGLVVERIQGADRYKTAVCIAERLAGEGAEFDTAIIAVGTDFADALAASSYAAMRGQPILLTGTNYLPQATKDAIAKLGIKNTVVCGGPGAVSESVFAQLPNPKRVYGNDRYLTALELAKEFMPKSTKHVYVATGLDFPDAVAGGVLAAKNNSGVLLVQGNQTVPIQQIQDYYVEHGFTGATMFGGSSVVSSELEQWFKDNPR